MDNLGPNSTAEEIENEILLYHVLVESLDPDDEDYEAKRRDIERPLHELEIQLRQLQSPENFQPLTPQRPIERSGNEFDLPSRDRDTSYPSISAAGLHKPFASTAAEGGNKRTRQPSWGFGQLDGPSTSKRSKLNDGTPSTSISTASTPATVDSMDEEEAALEERFGFNLSSAKDGVMKKILDRQRQQELRIKREMEDATFARQLEAQQQVSIPSASVLQRPTHQATFGADGQIRHLPTPAPSIGPIPPPTPSAIQQPNHNRPTVKLESTRPYGITPSLHQTAHSYPVIFDESDSAHDSSEDSLTEISPSQFAAIASPRSQAMNPPTLYSNTLSQLPPAWNSYMPNGYSHGHAANSMTGGTSVYDSRVLDEQAWNWMNTLQSTVGPLDVHRPGGYGAGPSSQPGFGFAPASQRALGIGELPFLHGEESDDDSDLQEILFRRGYDGYGDPAQTREELQKLLESIRPDELIPPEKRDQPIELKCQLHEHQKLGLAWLKTQEEGNNKGGILADDMGLGKTIQALALIVSRQSSDPARKTTLVVAPVALMRQWEGEIKDQLHSRYRLSTFIFHGPQKKVTFATLSKYDVVITTFGKIANEYKIKANLEMKRQTTSNAGRRTSDQLVLIGENSRWYRVILDEAQCIKNKGTKAAMGCSYLNATYRLCMSGTPLMNNVGELYSLIRFLRIKPYNEHEKFQRDFKALNSVNPYSKNRAMQAFQALLKAILLRRTKKSLIDGKPILQLPERSTEIVHAVFDEEEQKVYTALETETRLQVNKYLEAGKVGRNYSYILVRLLRLRQACCHPHLIHDFAEDGPGDIPAEIMRELAAALDQNVVARLKETGGNFECPICYDAAENPTIFFPCGHDVCSECFARMTDPSNAVAAGDEGNVTAKCPECRAKVDPRKVINWTTFKQAHLPSDEDEDVEADPVVKDDTDSETDDDDDADDETDADSQGDLRDFIVPDDEDVDSDATADYEEVKVEGKRNSSLKVESDDDHDDGDLDIVAGSSKPKSKVSHKKSVRGKGKSKAKARAKSKGKGKDKKNGKKKMTLADLKKESQKNAKAKKRYLRRLQRNYIPSAKITKCIEILREIRDRGEGEKTLIFSQFTSLLDLLEVAAGDEWRYRRYDGSMSAKDRDAAVQDFKRLPDVTVMLVSLKAGNAGLNLTAANQVIVLDPFWNPFIEEQAIDRAHRFGQTRPVQVHRILVQNTVEDRIIALQEKKRDLINQALDEKAGESVSRLGRAELAYLFGITSSVPGAGQ